jgi:IclR family transcriptional regulator, acetate operon repressor
MARADNKTTRRTLELLEVFYKHRAPMSLTELARTLQAPLSSCHGIVRTLAGRGYLYNIDAGRSIYPTKRLLQIAEVISANDPVLRRLAPLLADLRDASGETVILGKRQENIVVYLDVAESRQTIRYGAQPGDSKPLHSSAIGKALLAELDAKALDLWLGENRLERKTANTITSAKRLRSELEAGRALGYCSASGETTVDVMAVGIAVPLRGDTMGIAIAGPLPRITSQLKRHTDSLLGLKQEILAWR